MPSSTARSETRGLPPLGLGGSGGSSGRMTCQRFSRTSVFAVIVAYRLLGGQRTDLSEYAPSSLEAPYRVAVRAKQGEDHEKGTRRGEHYPQAMLAEGTHQRVRERIDGDRGEHHQAHHAPV